MKNFTTQIQALRDEMHKEIIMEVIRKTKDVTDFDLELTNPFTVWTSDWDGECQVQIAIKGIRGESHRLIAECITDGEEDENIDYQDLQFGELDYLYKQIATDKFTIKVY